MVQPFTGFSPTSRTRTMTRSRPDTAAASNPAARIVVMRTRYEVVAVRPRCPGWLSPLGPRHPAPPESAPVVRSRQKWDTRWPFAYGCKDQQVTERQRVVLVVAWGAAAAVAAITLNRLLADNDGGWFAYAPNTGVEFTPSRTSTIWREALVWVGAVVCWTGPSLWLLRSSKRSD